MNKIKVTDRATLDKLYDNSAFTIEGLCDDDKSIADMFNWIRKYTPVKNETAYIIEGSVMNRVYNLTGDNRYQDDLHIVWVMLDDPENPRAIVYPRFDVGGRWFDDIVDNNARREAEKGE